VLVDGLIWLMGFGSHTGRFWRKMDLDRRASVKDKKELRKENSPDEVVDFVVIGSGFGGSVSAMRLAEKGYSVLVLERGKRYEDKDFPKTNWNIWKSLWLPALRCFGTWKIAFLNGAISLHCSGVGGGSLMYANVLMEPDERIFESPSWRHLADWSNLLRPHYDTAKRMLGVTTNPRLLEADDVMREIALERGHGASFHPTEVAVFFGEENIVVPDPYFGGLGPERAGCNFCGGCMVGCRYNAKNTLPKNYLHFAEKWGVRILPEADVKNIRPLPKGDPDNARYEVEYRSTTAFLFKPGKFVRARNVIVAAGTLGTLALLFNCRDVAHSLPHISDRLGDLVRSNSENLQAVTSRDRDTDYSKGVTISSVINVDDVTYVEPVRFSDGSSLIRNLGGPLVDGENIPIRFLNTLKAIICHPVDFLYARFFSRWARYSTVLLMMQPVEELLRIGLGRNLFTLFRRGLVFHPEEGQQLPKSPAISNTITRQFASKVNGIPLSTFMDSLLNYPITAHLMGGVPFGHDDAEGVIGLDFQVHNYPGLYVVDGTVMPGNPGLNPSLTITALAEFAINQIPPKEGVVPRTPFMTA
jgi:cholesterol oxidase